MLGTAPKGEPRRGRSLARPLAWNVIAPPPPPCPAAYDKRKYMWKLLYTRILGYDVEFGQRQAMDLIAANG